MWHTVPIDEAVVACCGGVLPRAHRADGWKPTFFSPHSSAPPTAGLHYLFVHSSCRVSQNIASGRDFIDALSAEVAELEAEIAEAAEVTDLETARQEVHKFVTRHAKYSHANRV